MSFFLLLNTKEDISKNVGNQTVAGLDPIYSINYLVTDIHPNILLCVWIGT